MMFEKMKVAPSAKRRVPEIRKAKEGRYESSEAISLLLRIKELRPQLKRDCGNYNKWKTNRNKIIHHPLYMASSKGKASQVRQLIIDPFMDDLALCHLEDSEFQVLQRELRQPSRLYLQSNSIKMMTCQICK